MKCISNVFTFQWQMSLFSKTQNVSWFSSTGDGGTLTEVTDGNQRMNCDTSEQILERHRGLVDNHVALTGCQPVGSFSVIHWCFLQHYIIIIASYPHEGLCSVNFTFYHCFKLFSSFTLNVAYKILSGYTEFFCTAWQHCAPSAEQFFFKLSFYFYILSSAVWSFSRHLKCALN